MTRDELITLMDGAAREDRERFFKAADAASLAFATRADEIELEKQKWRDLPNTEGYPNIDFPLPLPDWFPAVHFASCWKKNEYVE